MMDPAQTARRRARAHVADAGRSRRPSILMSGVRAGGLAAVWLLYGCSYGQVQRAAYETLQNVGQQQCERSMASDCGAREGYEAYQRKRQQPDSVAR